MICSNCGEKLQPSSKFCGKCGTPISLEKKAEVIKGPQESEKIASKRKDKSKNRIPLSRFFARLFDVALCGALMGIFFVDRTWLMSLDAEASRSAYLSLGIAITWVWHLIVEPFLISMIKTTPGKALYGIRVCGFNNSRLNIFISFKRSIRVFVQGLFIGFPLLSFLAMFVSLVSYLKDGITYWDKKYSIVITSKISSSRRYITHLIIITLVFLNSPFAIILFN